MRIFVFILALLGGLACGGVGWIWKSDAASPEVKELMRLMDQIVADKDWEELVRGQGKDPEQARELVARFRQVIPLSYALLAAFPLAVGAGLLALNRRGPLAAPLFLLGVAAPFYFAWRLSAIDSGFLTRVAVITGPLILAGLLSFFVRPRRPRVEEGLEIEESEDALPERRPRPRPRKAASPAITAER